MSKTAEQAGGHEAAERDGATIFERWSDFVCWLMPLTDGFPRKARLTLVRRIDDLALDVLDDLTTACYTRQKRDTLDAANLKLTRLRVMLRLARDLQYLSRDRHEGAVRTIDQIGRMLGGWTRSLG